MEFSLFGGSTINIVICFAVLAFALIAIFTDSTPVKWVASLLAIAGIGFVFRRLFPSDGEIKRKYEDNQAAVSQYHEDRKKSLDTIHKNKKKVEKLKEEKARIEQEDGEVELEGKILDAEIEALEKQSEILEKSVDERQKKLDTFFSRKDRTENAPAPEQGDAPSVDGYRLKGDVEE